MDVIIHRGTHQIGGCVTEYRTKNTRIFIDFGAELDSESARPFDIEGVTKGQSDCDAVLFTHYHGDHIGLLDTINQDIPLYMGEASKAIAQILNDRLSKSPNIKSYDAERIEGIRTFKIALQMRIGDICITPFVVDHSAYDSYMFLIEADGKRVLHTGDFRTHGFRGKGVRTVLEKYVQKVDALVCEGTTLSRDASKTETENELKCRIKGVIEDNKYVFVVCSSTNIDRLAGICSVVPRGKYCLCDRYQLFVVDYIRKTAGERSPLYKFDKMRYYAKNLDDKMLERGFCMFVRTGNPEHKKIMEKFKHFNPVVVYSMWKGYLEQDSVKKFLDGYRRIDMHTSGHADFNAIKTVIDTVQPDRIIPIHTEAPEEFLKIAKDRIVLAPDGEVINIGGNMNGLRGLDDNHELLKALADGGEFHQVIERVKDESNQYWLGIRNDSVILYYMGGKILKIRSKETLSFDRVYLKYCKDKDIKISENFNINEWLNNDSDLRDVIKTYQEGGYAKSAKRQHEKIAQQEIMIENNKSDISQWYLVDMEYAVNGFKYGRFDMIAISKKRCENGKYKIALIELKSGMGAFGGTKAKRENGKIIEIIRYGSGIAGHANNFYAFLYGDKRRENLERLAKEIVTILSNYCTLGLTDSFADLTESDIDIEPENVECMLLCTDIEDKESALIKARKYLFHASGASPCCLEKLWGRGFDEKFGKLNLKISIVDKERIIDDRNFETITK